MSQGITPAKTTILVAPLDWGLGHATRVIPVIRLLLQQQCTVLIAAVGRIKELLQQEFPGLECLDLEGYGIQYSRKGWMFPWKIAAQVPHILTIIKKEHQWLQQAVIDHHIDAVISDNRYGLYHHSVPTVFIAHQLRIRTGLGNLADGLLQKLNYRYINRFTECWVPDQEYGLSLAGELSHPTCYPSIRVQYISPLTRFSARGNTEETHLLVLISGPEPQRSIWEAMIIHQLKFYKAPAVLVRGLPGEVELPKLPAYIKVFNHLASQKLEEMIHTASFVISRCGYSTVMDLLTMQKKSILVPTPGQAEQEYLATHLLKHNLALCIPQQKFRLSAALDLAASFPYIFLNQESQLKEVVNDFVNRLHQYIEKNKSNQPATSRKL
ncbi:MAG TPA: glycosyltransferase [Flavisolibacter sp.]|nr:glycosyltransferase [Flavisolibacter sp.]